jgi:rhodanese-related sulfurtransferase
MAMSRLMMGGLIGVLALLLGACGATGPAGAPQSGFSTIGVSDLKARLDAGEQLTVLDVRTPEEFTQDGHIAGATLMPLPELAQRSGELAKDAPIACFCRSGNRSRSACEQLAAAGFTNLVNVDGGIMAWTAAGYPVERP